MKRREDWPERLSAYIASVMWRPFVWGSHDCATFAAGAVQAVTGESVEIPKYGTAIEAARLTDEFNLGERMTRLLGEPIAPAMAQRGDVLLFKLESGLTCGVMTDVGIVAPGADHLLTVPLTAAIAAWKVGRA